MMTGGPEEERMTEVEGEAWMMGHVVVVMTPNPGSPWADLVVGVNGRKPERRAGDLLVVTPLMKEMMLMEMKGQAAASETVVLQERIITGGEHLGRKEAPGEICAEMILTVMIVVNVTTAVVIAVKETAGMIVNIEVHQENTMKVLGVVEAKIRGRSEKESGQERGSVSVRVKEKRVGAPTEKTLVVPRTRQMMMAGPLSAAKQQILHPVSLVNDQLVWKE